MTIPDKFTERDLELHTGSGLIEAIRFDGDRHGMTHCMSAVDFVFADSRYYYFIELKDPDNPCAQPDAIEEFKEQVRNDTLCETLIKKYRESWLYRWAQDKLDKPVIYCVILSCRKLTPVDYLILDQRLKQKIPIKGNCSWKRTFIHNCVVFDIKTWNEEFPNWQIRRISEANAKPLKQKNNEKD